MMIRKISSTSVHSEQFIPLRNRSWWRRENLIISRSSLDSSVSVALARTIVRIGREKSQGDFVHDILVKQC